LTPGLPLYLTVSRGTATDWLARPRTYRTGNGTAAIVADQSGDAGPSTSALADAGPCHAACRTSCSGVDAGACTCTKAAPTCTRTVVCTVVWAKGGSVGHLTGPPRARVRALYQTLGSLHGACRHTYVTNAVAPVSGTSTPAPPSKSATATRPSRRPAYRRLSCAYESAVSGGGLSVSTTVGPEDDESAPCPTTCSGMGWSAMGRGWGL
jgi:hypothetical protein